VVLTLPISKLFFRLVSVNSVTAIAPAQSVCSLAGVDLDLAGRIAAVPREEWTRRRFPRRLLRGPATSENLLPQDRAGIGVTAFSLMFSGSSRFARNPDQPNGKPISMRSARCSFHTIGWSWRSPDLDAPALLPFLPCATTLSAGSRSAGGDPPTLRYPRAARRRCGPLTQALINSKNKDSSSASQNDVGPWRYQEKKLA